MRPAVLVKPKPGTRTQILPSRTLQVSTISSMPEFPEDLFGTYPLYAVLFPSTQEISEDFVPYGSTRRGVPLFGAEDGVTIPHGLSREMSAALPGLWYCLHLPSTFWQLTDLPPGLVAEAHEVPLFEHRFFYAPVQLFSSDFIESWPPAHVPILATCPDAIYPEVRKHSSELGFKLEAIPFSELSSESLRKHWRAIKASFAANIQGRDEREFTLSDRLDFAPTALPTRWLARHLHGDSAEDADLGVAQLIRKAQWHQSALMAYTRLEADIDTEQSVAINVDQIIAAEAKKLRVPLTIALPGVAASYTRKVYGSAAYRGVEAMQATDEGDRWAADIANRSDSRVERAAIELLAAHHAIGRMGIGLMLPSIQPGAFTTLATLERHFAGSPNGPGIARLLARLNDATSSIWTTELAEAVASASYLTVFSNFPLGLLTYPGDTSPLVTRLPLCYQPMNPLSRTMQYELTYTPPISMAGSLGVLVAECISPDDPVGVISRIAWSHMADAIRSGGYPVELQVVEVTSPDQLRAALEEHRPGILVLSAHGIHRPDANFAGLLIGGQPCLGPELGNLPPVVLISACEVAPRGAGPVSISDMILRQGAMAVIGTQVPIDVRHNAILMTRLFFYLSETARGDEDFATLLDAWRFVQMSNAVNDVLNGSRSLREWGTVRRSDGSLVLEEFMNVRSRGQIRRGHVYEDTERILGEIADSEGAGEKVRGWFRNPGYVPESLFYVISGCPDKVYLTDHDD